jgi:hypothetical protein
MGGRVAGLCIRGEPVAVVLRRALHASMGAFSHCHSPVDKLGVLEASASTPHESGMRMSEAPFQWQILSKSPTARRLRTVSLESTNNRF